MKKTLIVLSLAISLISGVAMADKAPFEGTAKAWSKDTNRAYDLETLESAFYAYDIHSVRFRTKAQAASFALYFNIPKNSINTVKYQGLDYFYLRASDLLRNYTTAEGEKLAAPQLALWLQQRGICRVTFNSKRSAKEFARQTGLLESIAKQEQRSGDNATGLYFVGLDGFVA